MKITFQLMSQTMSAIIILTFLTNIKVEANNGLKTLKKILVLSRNNNEKPLSSNPEIGLLTPTGAQLEEFLGKYFRTLVTQHGLISKMDGCPTDTFLKVIANDTAGTIDSAKAFIKGMFGNCPITIHSSREENYKSLFSVSIRNSSDEFIKELNEVLNKKLEKAKTTLHKSLKHLNSIVHINESKPCKEQHFCNLSIDESNVVVEKYRPVRIDGALHRAYKVSDAILSSYCDGVPIESILEGQFTKAKDFKPLAAVMNQYYKVTNRYLPLAKDVSRPLLKFIVDSLSKDNTTVTLLHGHESNLDTAATAMGVKSFQPQHYEEFPAGSRIVFQKWHDELLDTDFIRIDLVYMSVGQIRNKINVSAKNQPKMIPLRIENGEENSKLLYPWNDFVKSILSSE